MHTLRTALLLLGLATCGCMSTTSVQTVVEENIAGHGLIVQLEAAEVGVDVQFGHPVAGEELQLAERIDGLLAELSYGRPKGQKLSRLMESEDRQRLAAGLARGLIDAGPRERLRFMLSIDDNAHEAWLTPEQRMTRGVAFVDLDGRFHLAFDLVDDRVDPRGFESPDPTVAALTRARLVSETGEDLGASTDDGPRKLWVAWPFVAGTASPDASAQDASVPTDKDAAKLELLDELLEDGIIDREEYERRRARLDAS